MDIFVNENCLRENNKNKLAYIFIIYLDFLNSHIIFISLCMSVLRLYGYYVTVYYLTHQM